MHHHQYMLTVSTQNNVYGRCPTFHGVFLGRDPGTLKSDIVSKTIHNKFIRI